MIRIKCPVDQEQELLLEVGFFEWEDCPWMIACNVKSGDHLLEAYFKSEDEAKKSWKRVRSFCSSLPEVVDYEEVQDADWQDEYKKYLKPWSSGELHWVPVWEKLTYDLPQGDKVVWLDACMAFGTGAHETTRLCAQRLLKYKKQHANNLSQSSLIDAGCGSGILGISAKLLGYGDVFGFDIDSDAVRVSYENAVFNEIEGQISFEACGLEQGLMSKSADVVIANIISEVLCDHCDLLIKAVKANGWLILSGILHKELDQVKACFERACEDFWDEFSVESSVMGEWGDLCFIRK